MSLHSRGRLLSAAAVTCAALAGPVAGAQASNATIVSTMNAYGNKILHDEAAVLNGAADYQKGNAKPLIKALRHEVSDIKTITGKVSPEATSTAAGATGKKDLIAGLDKIAKAYGALATDVSKASSGKPVSNATVKAAVATDKKGRSELKTGLKLLS
jgi:hypothetical protein